MWARTRVQYAVQYALEMVHDCSGSPYSSKHGRTKKAIVLLRYSVGNQKSDPSYPLLAHFRWIMVDSNGFLSHKPTSYGYHLSLPVLRRPSATLVVRLMPSLLHRRCPGVVVGAPAHWQQPPSRHPQVLEFLVYKEPVVGPHSCGLLMFTVCRLQDAWQTLPNLNFQTH